MIKVKPMISFLEQHLSYDVWIQTLDPSPLSIQMFRPREEGAVQSLMGPHNNKAHY
jgi:hypothetical protein